MKKIVFILFAMLFLSCCSNTSNNGYDYGTSSSQNMSKSSEDNMFERAVKREVERVSRKAMYLYDTEGTMVSSCSVYKGEFDGHTWYVFYGNLSSPSVVHDPLCSCTKKQ